MIETFYNVTAMNTRKTTASPTGGDTLVTISSFLCLLRPIENVSKLYVQNNIGKEFDVVTDESADIIVGDNLYISGFKYSVLGFSMYEDLEDSSDSYKNIRIVK